MATAPQAPQYTKQQWDSACQGAFTQFQMLLRSYKLEKPLAVFNLLLNYASQVQAITEPNPAKIAEAVHVQLLSHLMDRTSDGQKRQLEGRPLLPEDLVIRWTVAPPAVTKWFPKARASWVDEVQQVEKEAEQHQEYLKVMEAQEQWRKQCPGVISSFQPVYRGRVDYASIERVTKALQAYLDKYEALHQEDLQKYEADKTFGYAKPDANGALRYGWRVNWESVLARMEEFVEKEYARAEGRTPESERL